MRYPPAALEVLPIRIGRLPRSALFPYTTLFRSHTPRPGSQPAPTAGGSPSSCAGFRGCFHSQAHRTRRRRLRSEEHPSELQSPCKLVCRPLLETATLEVLLVAIGVYKRTALELS